MKWDMWATQQQHSSLKMESYRAKTEQGEKKPEEKEIYFCAKKGTLMLQLLSNSTTSSQKLRITL